ncbi:MAG: HAD family hydrolase [Candidatus Hodarchaeota archaeon]
MQKNKKLIHLSNKSLIAFDLDGTLTISRSSWEDIHKYFGTWESHGKVILQQFLRGELTYEEFDKKDAEVWIGRTKVEYMAALETIKFREGIDELITFLKERRCLLALISMGLKDIVERVAKKYAFDYWIGNELIWNNGLITGEVKINVGWKEKGLILTDILERFKIPAQNSIAIGDSTADIDMFETAGVSIAIGTSSEQVTKAADFVCKTENLSEIITFFA